MPTFKIFKAEKEVGKVRGWSEANLREELAKALVAEGGSTDDSGAAPAGECVGGA